MKSCCKEAFEQEKPDAPERKSMLRRLRQKWGVRNSFQVILILCAFAAGGSIAGLGGRKILVAASIESSLLWILLYIILVSVLWPACVLVVGTVLGQRKFFLQFLNRFSKKIRLHQSVQDSR